MSTPILGQDDWIEEDIDYLAKDGDLAQIVLPLIHEGDYELIEKEHGDKAARVTITIDLSLMTDDDGNLQYVDGPAAKAPYVGSPMIMFGVYSKMLEPNTVTVADARNLVSGWGIPPEAIAIIGKAQPAEDYVLQMGDKLEFFRKLQEKSS